MKKENIKMKNKLKMYKKSNNASLRMAMIKTITCRLLMSGMWIISKAQSLKISLLYHQLWTIKIMKECTFQQKSKRLLRSLKKSVQNQPQNWMSRNLKLPDIHWLKQQGITQCKRDKRIKSTNVQFTIWRLMISSKKQLER